jgi:peptide deformylase
MAILSIARMGNPILRKKARSLSTLEIHFPEIQKLVGDMLETMRSVQGIGLAAPQVFRSLQLAVIEFDPSNPRYKKSKISTSQPLLILFNPKIKVLDKKLQAYWEGCLSVPGLRGYVRRPRKIQVEFLDQDGEKQKVIAEGFLATVLQHELDHLKASLFLDHILPKDRERVAFLEEYVQFWSSYPLVD